MKPAELAKARILVTNDDGIHAPGLEALIEIATPALERRLGGGAGGQPERRRPFAVAVAADPRAARSARRKFALEGTPTDCVLFAVKHLLKDRKPDLVLSGVNRGTNIADDVTYSGTIAGAMEGCLLGIPSIAFSQAYTHPTIR